jgi:uncharacterized protein (DUF1778 family)
MAVRDYPQINIRVPPDVEEVLEAAAFVRKVKNVQALVSPLVIEHARQLAGDSAVQAALDARRQAAAEGRNAS